MITKNLAFAFRNIRRNKALAAINVLGLSIGITACLVIFLIVSYEMSFDRFQPDKDRIFRVYSSFSGLSSGSNSGVPTAFAVEMRETFTGIESLTNFHTFGADVKVADSNSQRKSFGPYGKIILTDPEYFDVFSHYEWLIGNPKEALNRPLSVVLTESRARIYFGDTELSSILGKTIYYRDSLIVTVSGVVRDVDERTDFDFTDFISFSTIEKSWLSRSEISLNNWQNTSSTCQLFVKLSAGSNVDNVEAQLPSLAAAYKAHNKDAQWSISPKLQPLEDLHFNSGLRIFNHSRSVVEKSTLHVLIAIAILLLVIGVINFVNLETAQASRHAKEVGVRKVLGSSRQNLIMRFLSESFILCVLAALMSVILAELSLRYFMHHVPEGFEFNAVDPVALLFLAGCIVSVTLLAGLYPALVLSSYRPALALKNLASSTTATSRSSFIRKGLTVFQFSFAQVLIVGTIVMVGQLEFMLNKDLGFDADGVVFISTPNHADSQRLLSLQNELAKHPEIEASTLHGSPPLTPGYASGIMGFDNGNEIIKYNVHMKNGDTSYLRVYDIELLAGRNFVPVDSVHEFVINETFMKLLGFKEPRDVIGKTLDNVVSIVGVVKDFHGQPLRNEIKPTVIRYRPGGGLGVKLLTPKNDVADLKEGMAKVEASYKKIFPDEQFEYFFVDERIQEFYQTEKRMSQIAGMSTVIAILISCLGLFGLSSFTVIQRTKEIGIRKVLGASINSILYLLSRDFLKLILIAFVLSAPIAFYITNGWLDKFAYKVEITAWTFIASGLGSLLIGLITMSFRTVNAAKADPVKSLRYE